MKMVGGTFHFIPKFDCNVVFYLIGTNVFALRDQLLLYILMDSTKVKNKKTFHFSNDS